MSKLYTNMGYDLDARTNGENAGDDLTISDIEANGVTVIEISGEWYKGNTAFPVTSVNNIKLGFKNSSGNLIRWTGFLVGRWGNGYISWNYSLAPSSAFEVSLFNASPRISPDTFDANAFHYDLRLTIFNNGTSGRFNSARIDMSQFRRTTDPDYFPLVVMGQFKLGSNASRVGTGEPVDSVELRSDDAVVATSLRHYVTRSTVIASL
jgi:hypothetical protein